VIKARVAQILPDGKIELSLRGLARDEMDKDAANVLACLQAAPHTHVSDQSDPEQIRALFGLSKKAFKRAIGRLLKDGKVTRDADGSFRPTA